MSVAVADIDNRFPNAARGAERRVYPRLTARELRGRVTARVKYGDLVRLIDLSAGGVLVEARRKLMADTTVVFEFAGPGQSILVPSRAVRVTSRSYLDDSGAYEGAFVFKRPLALEDLLRPPTAAWQKVIARCRDGRILQGYTYDFQIANRRVSISPTPFADAARDVSLSELDTVFFLREDVRGTGECRTSAPVGRRVAVTLRDGEVIVGTAVNYHPQGNGFFVHPADSSATVRVFVNTWAIADLRFL